MQKRRESRSTDPVFEAKQAYRMWHGITRCGSAPRTRGISSVGLEHLLCTQGVIGSSPLFSTKKKEGH